MDTWEPYHLSNDTEDKVGIILSCPAESGAMPVNGVGGIRVNQGLIEIAVNDCIPNQTHAMQRSFLFPVRYWT